MLSQRSERSVEAPAEGAEIDLRLGAGRVDQATHERVGRALAARGLEGEGLFVASSRSAALLTLFHVLADAGDELLVAAPTDPLFVELALVSSLHLASFPLVPAARWTVEAEALFDAPSERTRAVVLGHPSVPSGALLEPEVVDVLAELGLPIVCDEIALDDAGSSLARHPRFGAGPEAPLSALVAQAEGHVFVLVRGPEDLAGALSRRLARFERTLLGAPERAVSSARVRRNAVAMRARLSEAPCLVPEPAAGASACVGLSAAHPASEWRARLRARGVLVDVAEGIGELGHAWIALSLDVEEATFDEAVERFAEVAREESAGARSAASGARGPRRTEPR